MSALPRLLCRSDCKPSWPPRSSSKLGQGKKGVREGDVDRGEREPVSGTEALGWHRAQKGSLTDLK